MHLYGDRTRSPDQPTSPRPHPFQLREQLPCNFLPSLPISAWVGAYRPNRCCFVYRRAGKRGDDERSKIHSTPLLPRTGARRGIPACAPNGRAALFMRARSRPGGDRDRDRRGVYGGARTSTTYVPDGRAAIPTAPTATIHRLGFGIFQAPFGGLGPSRVVSRPPGSARVARLRGGWVGDSAFRVLMGSAS